MWNGFAREMNVPYLSIRLEDAREDEPATARRLASFLGLRVDEAAISAASIGNTKRLEEEGIAARVPHRFYVLGCEAAYAAGWRYHGKGASGYGKGQLSPAQWARASAVFGKMAEAFGYAFP